MDSLTKFQNPITGGSINLTNPRQLISIIGGIALLMILFGFGTWVKDWVVAKLPAGMGAAAKGAGGGNGGGWNFAA